MEPATRRKNLDMTRAAEYCWVSLKTYSEANRKWHFLFIQNIRAQDAGSREARNGLIHHETSCALFLWRLYHVSEIAFAKRPKGDEPYPSCSHTKKKHRQGNHF